MTTAVDPAFKKRYFVALAQMVGQGPNAPTASTTLPATMEADYVRVWG